MLIKEEDKFRKFFMKHNSFYKMLLLRNVYKIIRTVFNFRNIETEIVTAYTALIYPLPHQLTRHLHPFP